jgi:NADH-quinone oxidoreductase subunit G
MPIGVIGDHADLTYTTTYIGAGADSLSDIAAGNGFGALLSKAQKPLIIIGQGALMREDGLSVLALAAQLGIREGWNGLAVLHTAAARVGALDIGFVPNSGALDASSMARGGVDVLFNLGADEIDISAGPFVIYQGTHGDRGAHRADVILPSAAYTEKSGLYVNTEGRVQMADRAAFPPGDAREDWAIIRALSEVLGHTLAFDSLAQLRTALFNAYPHMARCDEIAAADAASLSSLPKAALIKAPFTSAVRDFYLTNPIARASKVMAECSALAGQRAQKAAE